ncbi:MAG: adenine phosphoribosyltransferase [Candidatus Fischerbacteria bacterium RBG_13_37_8]|uniref:Adenine phosphoribosyltransferase n=1 Tax=Candidatus Fischerbacteria bacterium RBG_13_37_8 TaxID=1817863 RepID=A0A1F5VM90_9BACT|nr:MAG: adenine phosphoribosyltransferase [Candidatus Fischerbacteria bacterium RBG_13_37_8]
MDLSQYIRNIPDFPIKGILFRDITTLLKHKDAFKEAIDQLFLIASRYTVDKVAAIESRGYIFASIIAYKLNVGFIPIRKPGKLPADTIKKSYSLEYGVNELEIHKDAIARGEKVLLIDDLLATGGTAAASAELIETLGGTVEAILFMIELEGLEGKKLLGKYNVHSLITYR